MKLGNYLLNEDEINFLNDLYKLQEDINLKEIEEYLDSIEE